MPTSQQIENALKQVRDQQSFFKDLLSRTLNWPLADAQKVGDIAYGWSQSDLNATGLERSLIEGSIWQIQPSAASQPWGVFVLEFKDERSLSPRQGLAGILRTVLKGLVGSRRKDATLPSWKREHLLFICTHNWTSFRFAYYRSTPDEPRLARLTTFGWSPDTSNRTVVEFNLPALAWPEDTSDARGWIAAWSQAFDKEPLTKDFFRRFDKALDRIKADLQEYQRLSSAEAYTQSQLLLERLIFLYFLQNRGWLNQDQRYLYSRLSEHAKNPDEFTYYHDFLDKLFWTLSTAPSGAGRLPGIPFLNGGLFDDDEFRQPAITRKTTPPLKVRNRSMQFVFQELLEAFNFTVTEDTPLHQEVAVDPEMLGKVFESIVLHAEAADPDATAPDKRKATGSYYTPRIVVHFICQEVLYQYLLSHLAADEWGPRLRALLSIDPTEGIDEEGKQLLKKTLSPEQAVQVRNLVLPLKCCDPAVGSGAFPVGLMHELVNLLRLLETIANGYKDPVIGQGSEWLHKAKAQIVENCLFGVDIQQQAIEICRLRLWLTLIVDYDLGLDPFTAEKSQFSRAIERISQLPNLEMNFRRGDSLHDHISGVPVVILPERASRYGDQFSAISKLGAELHKAKKAERKRSLRLDILEKRLSLSRAILEEELKEIRTRDSSLDSLFGIEESTSKKRDRNQREIENLKRALAKVESDQKELEKLRRRDADSQFYPKLRKLEGADFDSPFNFAWSVDFPGVFSGESGGFDIVVGNPPFVTARNPNKRELWRQRWPRVCYMKYQLVAPFFECSVSLLRETGELGFIVSNAFAKREFGKPLVEDFLKLMDIQKLIDCSGLQFPGHGTPTCLVFMSNSSATTGAIRVTGIVPGGGDLRTPPEESVLWSSIEKYHDQPRTADTRITGADLPRDRFVWPFNFDVSGEPTREMMERHCPATLRNCIAEDIGFMFVMGSNEVFVQDVSLPRRAQLTPKCFVRLLEGEDIRNWHTLREQIGFFPYDLKTITLATLPARSPEMRFLKHFETALSERPTFDGSFKDAGRAFYQYHQLPIERAKNPCSIAFSEIATHGHFLYSSTFTLFDRPAPVIKLGADVHDDAYHALAALLNCSSALFWMKQRCFNKGAGEDEHRDRFVYGGNKLHQLPIPRNVTNGVQRINPKEAARAEELGHDCWIRGCRLSNLTIRKLFCVIAPYVSWEQSVAGYNALDDEAAKVMTQRGLPQAFRFVIATRDRLIEEMIGYQEEMDWLFYGAYGLLDEEDPAVHTLRECDAVGPDQRPFKLWAEAQGDIGQAVSLIPKGWAAERQKLWESRLSAIRDNEHIRQIEHPVYKRRWDEQWKVGNQWRCGEIAYAAEFIDAFEWWLKEKAEWWLEHEKAGGPVELIDWTSLIWKDAHVQAAWPVAAKQYAYVEYELAREKADEERGPVPARREPAVEFSAFVRKFKEAVEEETVPEGFPFGIDYDDLKKKLKKEIPARLKKVRGKLNVPRERFHSVGPGQYKWAGLQFMDAPKKIR